MKVRGIYNYNDTVNQLENAMSFLEKSKSIEFNVNISISELDSEYKEIDNNAELTLYEAANHLGLKDSSSLRHAIKKGHFKPGEYRLVGKTYLILESALERYKNEVMGKTGFASLKKRGEKKG